MGRVSRGDAEDLEAYFPRITTRGVPLAELFERGRYFVRLDTCSLKDAADGGQGPVTSVKQLRTRLTTSARACNGISAMRKRDERARMFLYLFPWNDSMKTELEYRVFCPPGLGKIAAISQYKWHEPWVHADKNLLQQREVVKIILDGAKEVFRELMESSAMTRKIKAQGFTFDISEKSWMSDDVMLIELNDFGAMTGCGSCLYHWIRDAKILYGLQEKVEFRISI